MHNVNNPRHKLDLENLEKARVLYEERGWKMAHIAMFLGVNRSSIFFHIHKFEGWVRRVPVVKKMPEEVADVHRTRKKTKVERSRGSYAFMQHKAEMDRLKRQSECKHKLFMIRCSCCGKIVGSDSMPADPFVFEVMQHLNSKVLSTI